MKCPKCGSTELYLIYFYFNGYPELICKCGYREEISEEKEAEWKKESIKIFEDIFSYRN